MQFTNTLTITTTKTDATQLYKLLSTEQVNNARATTTYTQINNTITITITAQDPAALRAALNTVTQLIQTYEKVNNIP